MQTDGYLLTSDNFFQVVQVSSSVKIDNDGKKLEEEEQDSDFDLIDEDDDVLDEKDASKTGLVFSQAINFICYVANCS